jgi:hypothetical protein
MRNGVVYAYSAYVHCGLTELYADGHWWKRTDPGDDSGNPPPGWGNPFDVGTVQLKAETYLIYRSSINTLVVFAPTQQTPPTCS